MFRKVLYNTGSQIAGKIVTASSTLLVTLLIGKSLGPSGYGEFTKIFVFVGYFYTVADFGFNSIFIKLANDENSSNLFKSLLGLRLVLSILLATSAILISFFLPFNIETGTGFSPLVKTGIIIASLTIITQALFTTGNALFQKALRYDLSAMATIVGSVVMVGITYLLSTITHSLTPYIFVFVIGGFVYVIASYFLIKNRFQQDIRPQFDKNQFRIYINMSWAIGVALILNLLYFRIDIFILANFRSNTEVGVYGLGYQFFQSALAIPIFFANALYPILVKKYEEKIQEFKIIIRQWTFYLIAVSIILSAVLFLVAYLIPVIFDNQWVGSTAVLQILSLGMPFFFISALLWYLLIIYNKQKLLIYIYATGLIFNLIANFIFIPIYGFIAAAATTVLSEILILALQIVAIRINIPKKFY